MNRIITRGLGPNHLIITQGYGASFLERLYREVMRLTSKISRTLMMVSKWRKTDCA